MKAITKQNLLAYNDIYGLGVEQKDLLKVLSQFDRFEARYEDVRFISEIPYNSSYIFYTGLTLGEENLKLVFELHKTGRSELVLVDENDDIYNNLVPNYSIFPTYSKVAIAGFPDLEKFKEMKLLVSTPGISDFGSDGSREAIKIKSLNELSSTIRSELLNLPSVTGMFPRSDYGKNVINNIKRVESVFGLSTQASEILDNYDKNGPSDEYHPKAEFLGKIIAVVDVPKTRERIAIIHNIEGRYQYYNSSKINIIRYYVVNSDHVLYNYTDVGRHVWYNFNRKEGYTYRGAHAQEGDCGLPHLVFLQDDPFIPDDEKYLINYAKGIPKNKFPVLLSDEDTKRTVTSYIMEEKREANAEMRAEQRKTALFNRVSSLSINQHITINDVNFYRDRVEYDGQVFKSSSTSPEHIFKTLLQGLGEDSITFDRFIESFINDICPLRQYNKDYGAASALDVTATIGEVEVHYLAEEKTTSNNISAVRHHINGKRINREEVKDVISQALCFSAQRDYDGFIEQVSKCSLKIHNYLSTGLDFILLDTFKDTVWKIKLPIVRDKNKNYIKLGESLYKIKNLNKLITKSNKLMNRWDSQGANMTLDSFISVLRDDTIVGIKGFKSVGEVINKAKAAYEQAVKKSKELLANTEKVLGITEQTLEVGGRNRVGYLITGVSGSQYFVESGDDSADGYHNTPYPVFSMPTGSPICIVDKSSVGAQVGKDALVNRLFALKNDKFVSTDINTLNIT